MAITVAKNNLYRNGQLIDFGDEQLLIRPLVNIPSNVNDQFHLVVGGDRLDLLAFQYYKDVVEDASKYWWLIADANTDLIFSPFDIENIVGQRIRIPDILTALIRV